MSKDTVIHAVDYGVVWLAAIAAVSGAVGGCGAAGLMILGSKNAIRAVQALAYVSIGIIAGLLTFLFGELLNIDVDDTETLIRWSAAVGAGVPIALFSKNLAITAVLKKFGWEVQVTLRKQTEERRKRKARK